MAVTYESIASTTLGASAATITLSSIPSTYTDLRCVLTPISSVADIVWRFNGDTATNYSRNYIFADGVNNPTTGGNTNQAGIYGSNYGASTGKYFWYTLDVMNYSGSSNKAALYNAWETTNTGGTGGMMIGVGLWRSTSVINSVSVFAGGTSTFSAGTILSIYGIKRA